MAKQRLQFGDKNTADIELHLTCPDGTEYQQNPLYLHSEVLGKSEFYKAMLSDRWSLGKRPSEIKVTSAHCVENYIKCIQLMYSSQSGKRFCFSTVDEALAILPIASELLFHDGVDGCMKYLDAAPWSPMQESKFRALLASLQLNILPDLAARLADTSQCNSGCGHLMMLQETLEDMLHKILSKSTNSILHSTVEKYFKDTIKADSTSDIADTCRSALLRTFRARVDTMKYPEEIAEYTGRRVDETDYIDIVYGLLRLVDLIQRCDGELFETVLRLFCEDTDLLVVITDYTTTSKEAMIYILDLLINRFLKPVGNAEVITPASFRVSFLTNWVAKMSMLISKINFESEDPFGKDKFQEALERGIIGVAETLPLIEQRRIYNIWKDAFENYSMDLSRAFEWWTKKLQGVHGEPK